MEQTERERIIEILNKVLNPLDKLRSDLINEGRAQGKTGKKKKTKKLAEDVSKPLEEMSELTVKQCLEKYGQPTDDDHVESVKRIVSNNDITAEQLDSCLERVKYANDKDPKNDIRKYTYSCLYKMNSRA